MNITDFANGTPWLMAQAELEALLRSLPDPLTEAMAETLAVNFTPDPKERDDFMLRDGVAIIPITGALSKRRSFWSYFFGGASYADLTEIFLDALEDPDVQAVLFDVDSPGGTVNGVEAFASLIFESRKKKPCVAFAGGNMASCAYWIGSSANRVIAEATAQVGSIGVYTIHSDYSEAEKKYGIKRTVVRAGKYKAIGEEPLTPDRKKFLQDQVDYLYSLFIDTVARNRDVDSESVEADMADGRMFIGQQAVDAGLADAVGNIETAIENALELVDTQGPKLYIYPNRAAALAAVKKKEEFMKDTNKTTGTITTVGELQEAFPDLMAQIQEAAKAEIDAEKIASEAAAGERSRVLGLVKAHFGDEPGGKFETIVATDITVEQYKAIVGEKPPAGQSAEAESIQKAKGEMLNSIEKAGAENPGGGDKTQTGDKDFMAMVEEYDAMHKCGKTKAMQAIMKKHPEAHKAYIASVN